VLGEPLPWVALLVQALAVSAQDHHAEAERLRADAREQAQAVPGTVDGQAFEWIADADARLGPVVEAVIDGRYYWVPFERIRSLELEAPTDLRDVVWIPAHLVLANGGDTAALLPSRYPGSETDPDGLIQLARKTHWDEIRPGVFHGRGQRMLTTDSGEYPLLDVRRVLLHPAEA
jgi:type VI secretion system protein ImpE